LLLFFGYINLTLVSFLAATILPFSSEIFLSVMILSKEYQSVLLLLFAGIGNISGSVVNWYIGKKILIFKNKKWFPVSSNQLNKSQEIFNKFGSWSILIAWVPIIGDPITVLAGVLKVKFLKFFILVTLSKLSRYIFLIYLFK
jgi:membrane protein YqaA with SNARE-associated domain|tara:strand:- start:660 stop:1088 length:429 start_codon:yes stop_codon:yes gene_type:complete